MARTNREDNLKAGGQLCRARDITGGRIDDCSPDRGEAERVAAQPAGITPERATPTREYAEDSPRLAEVARGDECDYSRTKSAFR